MIIKLKTDHLIRPHDELNFWLGGLSFSTDHLLFSSEFSLFIIIRWSVNDRSPIVFVRIFFLYLFIYLLLLLFIFISPRFLFIG